jgi:RNA polymerase sigma factor (sigma-70 family)
MPHAGSSPETRTTLLRGVCQHDATSWRECVHLYDSLLRAYIRACDRRTHLGLDEADCEDIQQEILIKLYHRLPTFDMSLRFRTWLWTVTRNVVIDWVRRQRGRGTPAAAGPLPGGRPRRIAWSPRIEETLGADADQAPDQQVIQAHDRELLQHVLEKVKAETSSSHKWDCFHLRHVEDLSSAVVAARLGISVQAVDVNTWRVRARIRECCAYYDIEL